jgi:hypothetical protein
VKPWLSMVWPSTTIISMVGYGFDHAALRFWQKVAQIMVEKLICGPETNLTQVTWVGCPYSK